MLLVVNRYTPAIGLNREEVKTALKMEPYALLPNEYEVVQDAVLEGRPVAAGSRYGRTLEGLAARLTGQETKVKKKTAWFGLLQRSIAAPQAIKT